MSLVYLKYIGKYPNENPLWYREKEPRGAVEVWGTGERFWSTGYNDIDYAQYKLNGFAGGYVYKRMTDKEFNKYMLVKKLCR